MKNWMIGAVLIFLITSCSKEQECNYTGGTTQAPDAEELMVTDYLNTQGLLGVAKELDNSGMYYIIDAAGNSDRPKQCSRISVSYIGRYSNGVSFDPKPGSGISRSTATFDLYQLIEGWKRALPSIGEGGKMRLFIPPSLGYGVDGIIDRSTGFYIIEKNALLVFDIELVRVN